MQCDLIIKGKYFLTMDSERRDFVDGAIAIKDGRILSVGKAIDLTNGFEAKEVFDAGHSIILPGLINTHTHAAMTYFRGMADDLPLDIWLSEHIWPAEAKNLSSDFIKEATELACLEMIKSGTTCFNDMYFFSEVVAQVVRGAGMKAIVSDVVLDFPTASSPDPGNTIKMTNDSLAKWRDDASIGFAFTPHSIYAASRNVLEDVAASAKENSARIHIHVSETKKEVEDSRNKFGKSPVEYLAEIGLLSDQVVTAHSVWLDDNDADIFAKHGVSISHCPSSNMKLASGILPLRLLQDRGVNISLGTDGAASNNTLDMFNEMREVALLHKVNELDPTIAPAHDVVAMATINGARALKLDDRIGSLEKGKMADLIIVGLDKPHLIPIFDPYSHLVYAAHGSDVDAVLVDGRFLMRDRKVLTIDEKKTINRELNIR